MLNGIGKIVVRLMNWMDGVDDGWFLPDPGVSGVRYMGPGVSMSLQELFENFTDVTLADDGVDGCHLIDGGGAQCGLGEQQGGRQGGGT